MVKGPIPVNNFWDLKQAPPPSKSGSFTAVGRATARLKELGMSDSGIHQLSFGQTISDKNDRAIIAHIVAEALG